MNRNRRGEGEVGLVGFLAVALVAICCLCAWGCPKYQIYTKRMSGEAELAQAEGNRQIATKEAEAKLESAKMLAQAEVERAKGVAEANKIIGESLHKNEDYLKWLWIEGMKEQGNITTIYIPTEANMPILEAGRSVTPSAPVGAAPQ